MKRLLLILILTFSFQTLTKADDIRDFEIEGMSIGDSLLDYFTNKQVKKFVKITYDNDSLIHTACYDFSKNDTNSSDRISVSILTSDFVDYQRNRAFTE